MSEAVATQNTDMDRRFFRNCITAMAVVLVGGFVVQLLAGRSSFNAPLVVHAHAVLFMGWVAITLTQVWLASNGARQLHLMLGMLAIAWACALLVLGTLVSLNAVQTQRVPFFFQPQHFLLSDMAILIGFLLLFGAAVALRHKPDWHARLQVSAFVMLMGPGLGRLLPMPFLPPYAFEIASIVPLIVPAIGMVRDQRVHGRVHPAWLSSIVLMIALLVLVRVIAFSPLGDGIYAAVTKGSIAEGTDGRAFPKPPGPPSPSAVEPG
jgi:hypothetical protein